MINININKNKSSGRVVRSLLTSGVAFALLVGIGTSCSPSMDEESITRTGAPMTVTATMQGVGKPAATISEVVSGSDATLPSSRTTASDVATGGSYTASWQKGDLVNVTFHCYSDAGGTTEIASSQMAGGNIQMLTYDGTSWMAMPTSLRLPAGTYSVKVVYSYIRTYSPADDSPIDATTTSMIINRGTEQIEGQSTVLIPDDITKTGIAIAPAADNWQRQTALIRLTGLALGQSVTVTTASGVATTVSCPTVQTADPTQPANAALTSTVCLHQQIDDPANTAAVTTVTAYGLSGVVKPTFHTEMGRLYSINAPLLFGQQGVGDVDGGQSYTTWRGTYAQFNNNDVGVINIDKYKEWIIDLSAETETGQMGAVNVINGKINSRTTAVNLTLTGIKTISENAFFDCNKLASINLPVATSIGKNAFYNCTALTSVSLPSVITIGDGAFWGSAFTSLNLPAAVNIGINSFRKCIALTNVSLPLVTGIGISAFCDCTALTSVSLPAAISFGDYAFSGCTALTGINLPAATTFGENVFSECIKLTSINLPAATTIGNFAFYNCPVLTTLKLTAAGVITLITDTFYGYTNSANCTLYLNTDKQSGSVLPQVEADGLTWGGVKWKEIKYE